MSETFVLRTSLGPSLALQCLAYRLEGAKGQDENAPLTTIPRSLLKPRYTCPRCQQEMDGPEASDGCRVWYCPAQEDSRDWPDDHKLDDPRRGQAKWINGR